MRKQNLVTWWLFVERSKTSDKSYPGDNRLVGSESSYRRSGSAPRCRLILARGWRRSQAFGCSPIKRIRELGSDRRETGWSLSATGVDAWRESSLVRNLLLPAVMRDDKSANNGEILIFLSLLITIFAVGPSNIVQFTWGPEVIKTIPWEVNLKLI